MVLSGTVTQVLLVTHVPEDMMEGLRRKLD